MQFFIQFIIFVITFSTFNWIFNKWNISERIFNKSVKVKYYNFILVIVFFLFVFTLEYGKQVLNDFYGQHNYMTLTLGAFLGVVYIKFVPYMFRKR